MTPPKEDRMSAELSLNQFEIAVREYKKIKELEDHSRVGNQTLAFLADRFETPNTVDEIIYLVGEIVTVHPELANRAYDICYELACVWEIQDQSKTQELLGSLKQPGE